MYACCTARLTGLFKLSPTLFPALLALLFFTGSSIADTFSEAGDAYKRGDYATAAAKFKEVAAKGDHRAMYALGSMYAGGTGVKQDYRQAFKWFASAARYGRPDALYKLGLMYELGAGVKQDYRRAAHYYLAVARKGYAHGQFRFGLLYLQGKGVKRDPVRAYAWMAAARQNFLNSMPKNETAGADADTAAPAAELQSTDIFATPSLNLINAELDGLRARLNAEQMEKARQLEQEYLTYK